MGRTGSGEVRILDGEGSGRLPSVRVSPHTYLKALFLATFISGFLLYLELDTFGLGLLAASWLVIPALALADRIRFDGKRLTRIGPMPKLWSWFNRSRRRLKLSDIEQVETHTVRALKRGGSVIYRYRTTFRGKGLVLTVASGGESYRRFISAVLPGLDESVLDARSIELRDHLADPKEILMKAEFSRIPSSDVLEGTFRRFGRRNADTPVRNGRDAAKDAAGATLEAGEGHLSDEASSIADNNFRVPSVDDLRSLGNQLRLSGHLARALEAFRRALHLDPNDARLLFDFARCLYSFAGMQRDRRLERKALAMLRLSQRRAGGDGDLLNRLGEWYFQIGQIRRAGSSFKRAVDRIGENFRAARGMAEIALREGKIAHVIHHFAAANRVAETPALRRWAGTEAEYFARLNDDEEYMEMEVARVNLLETVENSKRTALRIAYLAFPAVLFGVLFEDDLIANIGWAVSIVTLLIWVGLSTFARIISQRIPHHMIESNE